MILKTARHFSERDTTHVVSTRPSPEIRGNRVTRLMGKSDRSSLLEFLCGLLMVGGQVFLGLLEMPAGAGNREAAVGRPTVRAESRASDRRH